MTEKEIQNLITNMRQNIARLHLGHTLDLIIAEAERSMSWEIADAAKSLARDYNYMLDYMAAGYPDDSRHTLYKILTERTLALIDRLERSLLSVSRPSLYFSTMRVDQQSGNTTSKLLDRFDAASALSVNIFARLTAGETTYADDDRYSNENVASELFNNIWVSYTLSSADAEGIKSLIIDGNINFVWRSLLLSAVMLGELEFHDTEKMNLLIDVYGAVDDTCIRAQSLVALLLCLFRYRKRGIGSETEAKIKLLKDLPDWKSNIRMAFLEFIRTRDTERITHKINNEIIPEMMNMRPEMMKRFETIKNSELTPESLELNPEWEEMMRKSGLSEKLKQMNDIQQEGGDVFMSTFSHLKRFPFFHEAVNWFLPFDPENTEVLKAVGGRVAILDSIASLPFLCDSDKYSMAMAFNMVPADQRDMIFDQLEAQKAQYFGNIAPGNETARDEMRREIRRYLQNYYRFLKLFRRKGEFFNPFDNGVNLMDVDILADDFNDIDTLRTIAEFFFKLTYWQDALYFFDLLLRFDEVSDGSLWQKIGYCYEQLGNTSAAIEHYQRSEIFTPDSRWLIHRLYACYRLMGNYDKALEYARRLSDGEDMSAAMTLGYALLEAGRHKEALCEFHRAEFIDETSTRPWRPLAWTLFLEKDFDGADSYYRKIVETDPQANDWVNMGHNALASGKYHKAFEYYRKAIDAGMTNVDFSKAMAEDMATLSAVGVDNVTLAMITDAVIGQRSNIPPFQLNHSI